MNIYACLVYKYEFLTVSLGVVQSEQNNRQLSIFRHEAINRQVSIIFCQQDGRCKALSLDIPSCKNYQNTSCRCKIA